MEPLVWTEAMVESPTQGLLHTGIWKADWIGTYEFRECISAGPLYWIANGFIMKIVHPKGENVGFTLEQAKDTAEQHRIAMVSQYTWRG